MQLTARQYSQRSLRHYWRIHLAVLLAVAVGTAVLTGALVVGDSVRHSLRRLTLERLGAIDQVLLADHFFSAELADRLKLTEQQLDAFAQAVPVILLSPTTVEHAGATTRTVGQVTLIACHEGFWQLDTRPTPVTTAPGPGQIVLNRPLADQLNVKVGDRVVVRLPSAARIAADSALGEKQNRVLSLAELQVTQIIPAQGLGRFTLQANQALPKTAFLALETVQRSLDQANMVNALLIGGRSVERAASADAVASLQARIRPTLADAGLHLKNVSLEYYVDSSERPQHDFQYLSLTSDTLMFPAAMEQAVSRALAGRDSQRVFAYLANSIARVGADGSATREIPYSIVAALEHHPRLTPLIDEHGESLPPMADDEIVLTRWAADDLQVEPGEKIRLTYFEPETTHGETREASHVLTLKAIVPLDFPAVPFRRNQDARFLGARARTNDPDLTPIVPGITDADSIDAWDPPFPFDHRRIRNPQDEDYWDQHRTTPKAFIDLTIGQRLWRSRFGKVTSFRIAVDPGGESVVERLLEAAIAADLPAFGFSVLPVKQEGLRAAAGTTPFNLLFLGFSVFLIAAALMLVCLMFRLSLEQRAAEHGLLLSVGLTAKQVARLMLREGVTVALIGGILGALLGVAYAALMILGLRTWWLAAVVTPFLELHVGRYSLPLGMLLGILAALAAISLTVVSLSRLAPQRLLSRELTGTVASGQHRRQRWALFLSAGCWTMGIVSAVAAVYLSGEAQAGAFFTAGAAALAAILLYVWWWLRRPLARTNLRRYGFSLGRLTARNISRNPLRTLLTLALMAMASFLIVAISAFRLSPTSQGTGGFSLLAQSDSPIFDDLSDSAARDSLLAAKSTNLSGTQIFAWRLRDGDDASCRNLYQVQSPRVLGVTPRFVDYFDTPERTAFGWGATAASTDEQRQNPWRLLTQQFEDGAIPVVLDKNTALYSLHLYGGIGEQFELDYGPSGKLRFRVVGLLANSVLQGSLLVSEANLVKHFPDVAGYRYFLIAARADRLESVQQTLESAFRDQGLRASNAHQLLAELLAVQNTYLSTFQSLGGLGLLLGTLGLVAVQLRSVFERRAELALLRATGFSQRRLGRLVLLEHLSLLCGGLGIGVAAALVAVIPHAWTTSIRPPLSMLGVLLAVIVAVGLVAGAWALRPISRAPIVAALRSD